MSDRTADEVETRIVQGYQSGRTGPGLAVEHGVSESTVFNILRRHRVASRDPSVAHARYAVNDRYFDVVDTEEKAYWLGFLSADGCVRDRGVVKLTLAARDGDHVRRFAAAIGYEGPVAVERLANGRRPVSVVVHRRRLAEALIRLGVVPRKTWSLRPWSGPPDLMRHYWRGFVDGDGHVVAVGGRSTPCWEIGLIGTRPVVAAFAEFLHRHAHVTRRDPRRADGRTVWRVTVGGVEQPQLAARLLYADCTIALPRKQQEAARLLAARPQRSHLHLLTVNGETKPLDEWAGQTGLTRRAILDRMRAEGVTDRLFRDPHHPRMLTCDGLTLPLGEWAKRTGINHQTISARLARGWSVADALNPRGTANEC